jgi:hypothetical protein
VKTANNDKLSLVGMQLPEKYKEKFHVSSETNFPLKGLRSKRRISPCISVQGSVVQSWVSATPGLKINLLF